MTIWLYFTLDVLVDSVILIIASASPLNASCRVVSYCPDDEKTKKHSILSSFAMEIEFTDGNFISNYFLLDSRWTDKQEPLDSAQANNDPVAVFS